MEKKIISRNHRLKSLLLWVAVFVFAASNIGTTVFAASTTNTSGGGSVQDASTASIKDQAYSYQAYILLTRDKDRFTCGRLWAANISPEDVGTAKWFGSTDTTRSGSILSPENGQADCNDGTGGWLGTALQQWGYASGNYSDFLEAVGFQRAADGGYGGAPGNLVENTRKVIQDRYYGGKGPQFNAALAYRIYYENFMNGCQFDSTLGPNPSKDNQAGPNIYKISIVDSSGAVKTTYVKMKKGQTDRITVGYDVGIENGNGFELSCAELASKLNDAALTAPYAAYVKAHPTDTNAPTGDKDGNPVGNTGAIVGANGNTDGCYNFVSVFGWILCPMLDLADGIYGFLRSSVFSLLAIPEVSNGATNGLQASWAAVRNVANTLLVLVALFMIASQIFNFSFVDAYTVKKVLPRLVIAAILIQLSWFLFTTMVELFNALGYGLNWLITAPFAANGGGDIVDIISAQNAGDIKQATIFTGTGLVIGGVAFAVGTVLSGGFFMTLAIVAIGVIISVAAVILTLIIRKLLIIALLVTAPIALVAWILPNTQKFWNSWWQLFSKLLIMFPLIALLFAAGQIFATIAAQPSSGSNSEGGLKIILVIIAYFAPLFLIPATFKFAGGIFGSITGVLNGASSKMRGGKMFGLKEKRDASRKAVTEEKNRNAYNRIGAGRGTVLDKWRTNTMGGAILPTTKSAYNRRTELAVSQGKKLQHDEAQQLVGNAINNLYGEDKFNQLEKIAKGETVVGKNGQSYAPDHYAQAIAHSQLLKQKQAANADRVAQHLQTTDMDTWQLLQDENYAEINDLTPDKLVSANGARLKRSDQLNPTAFGTVDKGRFQTKKDSAGNVISKGAYVEDVEQALATSNKEQLDNFLVQLNSISKTAQQAGIPPEVISGLKSMGHPAVTQVLSSDGALQLQHTVDPTTGKSVFTAVPTP